jgi:hypothetical protein
MNSTAEHRPSMDALGSEGDARTLSHGSPEEEVTLLELLDRVLDKGIVLSGDITLSVADIDLVYVGLRVLLTSIEAAQRLRSDVEQHPIRVDSVGGR